jgi:hypothetical protein
MMLMFGLAFLGSMLVSMRVFSSGRITADEGSYVFQAGNFLDGEWRREPQGLGEMLKFDMIVLDKERGWFSRYAPGHAIWLIPGVALGWPQLMTALAAGISCASGVVISVRLGLPRLLLPVMLLMSPFFLFLHGTLLSHTSGVACTSVLLAAYMTGRQSGRSRWLVLAGSAWGFLFLNRTWTAVWVALPFAVDSLWILWNGRKEKSVWIATICFAMPTVVGVGLYLIYNHVMTGDAGLATYLFYEPSEKLGFGWRRVQGGEAYRILHTPMRGLKHFGLNLLDLDRWLFGVPKVSLLAWLGFVVWGWSKRWSALLVSVTLLVPMGYIAFWFVGIPDVGPLYQSETLPFLMAAGGLGLMSAWKKMTGWPLRSVAVVAVVAVAASSFRFMKAQAQVLNDRHGEVWKIEKQIQALPGNSILFVDKDLRSNRALHEYVRLNDRGFNSRIVRLSSSPAYYWALAKAFPDRTPWILRKGEEAPVLEPYPMPDSPPVYHRVGGRTRGLGHSRENSRIVPSDTHKEGFCFYGWYPYLPPGPFEVEFDIRVEGVNENQPVRVEVMTDLGTKTLVEKNLTSAVAPVKLTFTLDRLSQIEPRVYYGGSGQVNLHHVTLRHLSSTPETP